MRARVTLSVLVAAVLWAQPPQEAVAGSREPVRARSGMVVSSHYLASQVGVEILKRGGKDRKSVV